MLSLAVLSLVFGGGGWMFLKGLHLEDIQQIVTTSATGSASSVSSGFPQSSGGNAVAAPRGTASNTIRIASFNIQVFGDAKASKPYVIDELAKIISQFDLVAIQEIRTQDDYFIPKFLSRVHQLTGRRFDSRVGPRLGNTRSTEQYAFLFDIDRIEVNDQSVYTIRDPENLLHREPHVAMFRVRGVPPEQAFTFVLINIHTDPDVANEEMDALAQVYSVVRRSSMGEDDILLLGDLNTNVPSTPPGFTGRDSRALTPGDLYGLGRLSGIYPVVQNSPTNVLGTKLHDNILLHRPSTTEYTGRGGVYDIGALHGLTLEQVQQVSDHLPVWAEFNVYESGQPGRLAVGATGPPR